MKRNGFTLVELLVVIAIIGILAAMAVISLASAVQRGKQKKSMADMRTVGLAVSAYAVEWGFSPKVNGPAELLKPHVEPTYIRKLPSKDGWGHSFRYTSDGVYFTIISYGANGIADEPYTQGPTHDVDEDIVMVSGEFYQWPEGAQE